MREDMIALGIEGDKIRVHYTGVDFDRFRPAPDRTVAKAALGLSGPVIISTGALIPRKGQDLLIRALPALPNVTLLLAGAGAERAGHGRLAKELGGTRGVRLLGRGGHEGLPAVVGAAGGVGGPSVFNP